MIRLKTTGVILEVVGAEQDPRHVHRVLRALRVRDRAHERLVRVAHVRVDHVVVPLVHREVDGLADGPARVVQVRRHVGELHEVLEVLDRAVAAPAVQVADERRAVRRSEDGVHAADLDVVRGVARVLREALGRRRLDRARRHIPRGNRTRSPSHVGAGRPRTARGRRARRGTRSRPAPGSCRRSARSISSPSSVSTSNGGSVRVMYGTRSGADAARAACRPARPPVRLRGRVRRLRVRSSGAPLVRRGRGRGSPATSAALVAGRAARAPRRGERHDGRQPRRRLRSCAGSPSRRRNAPGSAARSAVSIFSTRRTTSSISARAARFSSAIRAPVPGGVAGRRHVRRGRSRAPARGPARAPGRCARRTRRRAGCGRRVSIPS